MSKDFLRNWAMIATAAALVLLGVLIGRNTASGPDAAAASAYRGTDSSVDTSGADAAETPVSTYVIPENFTTLPSEWRTVVESGYDGYAILFDPQRREVIVEQCLHPGYFDTAVNRPVEEGQEFCTNVLWGNLLEISETSAKATDRNNQLVELELALTGKGEQQRLALTFGDHRMALMPGSKNDLYQEMDRTPTMVTQKNLLIEFQEAEYQQLKARRQSGETGQPDIPRYTLPDRESERNEDQKHEDQGPEDRPRSD